MNKDPVDCENLMDIDVEELRGTFESHLHLQGELWVSIFPAHSLTEALELHVPVEVQTALSDHTIARIKL